MLTSSNTISTAAFVQSVLQSLRRVDRAPPFALLIGGGCSVPVLPTTRDLVLQEIPQWLFSHADGDTVDEAGRDYPAFERKLWDRVRRESLATISLDEGGRPLLSTASAQHNALAALFHPRSSSGLAAPARRKAFLSHLKRKANGLIPETQLLLASILLEQEHWGVGGPLARAVFCCSFDTLLADALNLVQRPYCLADGADSNGFPRDDQPEQVHLIYTHGTWDQYRPPAMDSRAEGPTVAALASYFEQRGVIAIGYSGWPDSVMAALLRCERFEHGLFWCGHDAPGFAARHLRPECLDLLGRHAGNSHYVQIESASALLSQLHVSLGLGASPTFIREPLRPVIDRLQGLRIAGLDESPAATLQELASSAVVRLRALNDEYDRESRGDFTGRNDSPLGVAAQRAALAGAAAQYAAAGDYAGACEALSKLLARADLSPSERWQMLRRRASVLAATGSAEAERDWLEVLRNPDAPADLRACIQRERAEWHTSTGRDREAVADWTDLLALDPPEPLSTSAFLQRGMLYQRMGRTEEAILDLDRVLASTHAPLLSRAKALFARGAAHQAATHWEAACGDYTELLALEEVPAEARVLALVNRAAANLERGDSAAAAGDATELLKLELEREVRREVLVTRARALARLGQHDAAVLDLNAVLNDPQCAEQLKVELLRERAQSNRARGRLEEAFADCNAIGADTTELVREQAELLRAHAMAVRESDPEAALAAYARILAMLGPAEELRGFALCERGSLLLERGDSEAAWKDFNQVLESQTAPPAARAHALNQRGVLHRKKGDLEAAIGDYTAALGVADAPPDLRAWALNNRGVAHRKHGNLSAAIADYTAVLEITDAPAEQVIKALNNRGVAYGVLGQTDRALADYNVVIERHDAAPEQRAKALQNRAIIFGIRGETDKAIVDYSAVLALTELPSELIARAYNNRAAVRAARGNLHGALADYSAVLDLPDAPVELRVAALNGRGYVHNLRGATAREIDDYSTVIDIADAPPEQRAWALNNRGIARAAAGELAEAVADHSAVLELSGISGHQRAWALNNRAFAHRRNNDVEKEVEDSQAVLSMTDAPLDQRCWALANRGWLHLQQRQVDDAVQLFRNAVELDGTGATQRFNLGMALLVQGAAGLAAMEFELAMQLNPSSEQLDDVLRDLGFLHRLYGPMEGMEQLRSMLR